MRSNSKKIAKSSLFISLKIFKFQFKHPTCSWSSSQRFLYLSYTIFLLLPKFILSNSNSKHSANIFERKYISLIQIEKKRNLLKSILFFICILNTWFSNLQMVRQISIYCCRIFVCENLFIFQSCLDSSWSCWIWYFPDSEFFSLFHISTLCLFVTVT